MTCPPCERVCFLDVVQGLKNQVKVKLSIVSCPPVTTVLIKRPDLKFQLGFSVQNGIVSTLPSVWSMTLKFRFKGNSWFLKSDETDTSGFFTTSDLQSDARRHS